MKKVNALLSVLFLSFLIAENIYGQCQCSGSSFIESYSSSSGWYSSNAGTGISCPFNSGNNGKVGIASGALQFIYASGGREDRVYRPIPTLNNISWTADFTFSITPGNSCSNSSSDPDHVLIAFSNGTSDLTTSSGCPNNNSCNPCSFYGSSATNAIGIYLKSLPNAGINPTMWYFQAFSKDASTITLSNPLFLNANPSTIYYLRLQRISGNQCILTVCTDPNYTNHLLGSPVCFNSTSNIINLNTLQHAVNPSALCTSVLNAGIDDLKVSNTTECGWVLSPNFTAPSGICLGSAITVDGSATGGNPYQESDYKWSITEYNGLGQPTGNAWSQTYTGQVGIYTFPAPGSGGPNFIKCGKNYYVITLTVWNCGTLATSYSKSLLVRCNPTISISSDNNSICDEESAVLTASGASTYTWSPYNTLSSQYGSPVTATPHSNTTYFVTGTNSYGCIGSAYYSVYVTPLTIIDLSTGRNDVNGSSLSLCSSDDTWRIRGIAGVTNPYNAPCPGTDTYFTTSFSSLSPAKVVYSSSHFSPPIGGNTQWISNASDINCAPLQYCDKPIAWVAGPGNVTDYFWYEAQFTLPAANFANYQSTLKLSCGIAGVDNAIDFFINGQQVIFNTGDLSLTNIIDAGNFTSTTNPTNLNPSNNSTNMFIPGVNTIQARIRNRIQISPFKSVQAFYLQDFKVTYCDQSANGRILNKDNSETESNLINVYPNPTSGSITLIVSPSPDQTSVEIFNSIGERVYTVQFKEEKLTIDLSALTDGIYFIKAGDKIQRLVKTQ